MVTADDNAYCLKSPSCHAPENCKNPATIARCCYANALKLKSQTSSNSKSPKSLSIQYIMKWPAHFHFDARKVFSLSHHDRAMDADHRRALCRDHTPAHGKAGGRGVDHGPVCMKRSQLWLRAPTPGLTPHFQPSQNRQRKSVTREIHGDTCTSCRWAWSHRMQ